MEMPWILAPRVGTIHSCSVSPSSVVSGDEDAAVHDMCRRLLRFLAEPTVIDQDRKVITYFVWCFFTDVHAPVVVQ